MKPDCYNCRHRGAVPGDTHSCCKHPDIKSNLLDEISSLLGLAGQTNPGAAAKLNIRGADHGINNGWFIWPISFDPVWLERCDGYDPIERPWWESFDEQD